FHPTASTGFRDVLFEVGGESPPSQGRVDLRPRSTLMAVWLVTGGNGFVGRQVLAALASGESGDLADQIVVLGRHRPATARAARFIETDLGDPEGLRASLRGVAPDYVIHTAGKTPPASDDELYRANFWSTTHLLGALRALGKSIRIVLAGSAAELGPVD